MKNVAIYGAGGLGREIALHVKQTSRTVIGFFDDGKKVHATVDGLPLLGGRSELNVYQDPLDVIIAIASPQVRESIVSSLKNNKIDFPTSIHPNALIDHKVNRIGKGCLITANCLFTTGISVGDFVIVNLSCTIGHDVELSDFVSIMPGVNISGNVKVGDGAFVGSGAIILQGLTIGKGAVVGAGAVVTKDVAPAITVVGVPARPLKK
jgi:sugar O-acyltransferase (sialic acid O-acetyltransferase NeuD family)